MLSKWLSESSTVSLYVLLLRTSTISSDSSQDNGRTIATLVAAKHNGLELDLVKTEASCSKNSSPEYRKVQPLGKIPAFEGANGFKLSEAIAIAIYGTLMTSVLFGFFSCFAIRQFLAGRLSLHDEIQVIPVITIMLRMTNF